MLFDYSQAPDPRDFSELIPHGTIATVQMRIRPGNAGPNGLYKRTAKGDAEMLDCEFVVLDGPYAKRKVYDTFLLVGTTPGQQEMVLTNRGRLKKILESARGIKPDDMSPQARAARTASVKDFDNLTFIAKIGIEKGKPRKEGGNYDDRNIIAAVITPDQADYRPVVQTPPFNGGGAGGGATPPAPSGPSSPSDPPIEPPPWAR